MAKTVELHEIVRIEGHMNFTVVVHDGDVKARAEALEGTRLLERLLIGRRFSEIPDIASRMCGVCQAIHRVTAVQALEAAFGIELPEDLEALRKLVVIGGHIQSHILHLHLFVLPDFLGHDSVMDLAASHGDLVRLVFRVKKLANMLTEIIGGRAVHPVTPIVGGFSRLPSRQELERVARLAREIEGLSVDIVEPLLSLDMPEFSREKTYIALYNRSGLPLLRGYIASSSGIVFSPEDYDSNLRYVTESYSMARHYLFNDREYMVGALSRLNINYGALSDTAKELAKKYDLEFPSNSPFDNNKAQALEIVHFAEEIRRLSEDLLETGVSQRTVAFRIRKGDGVAATEAPRGLLIHHYKLNDKGRVEVANMITPTAQNYKSMETDAEAYVKKLLDEGVEDLELEIEKLIRAYDPCVSCSARFFREH